MSDLGDLHEKINKVDKAVGRLDQKFDTLFPFLATTEHVTKEIAQCREAHKNQKSIVPPKLINSTKLKVALISTGGIGIATVIYALIDFLTYLASKS